MALGPKLGGKPAKKRMTLAVSAVLLSIAAFSLSSESRTLGEGFPPKNDLKIPVGDVGALGIKEDAFNRVIDKASAALSGGR